jgi:hypothetical protein
MAQETLHGPYLLPLIPAITTPHLSFMTAAHWEEKFQTWAAGPGKSESDRIENAVTAIRKAMDANAKLGPITKVYVQGSYRNRVNVRQESDVDIGVLYTGLGFYGHYPEGTTRETFGNVVGPYSYSEFKEEVAKALVARFGADGVHRGEKAFDIHPNSYRVDADVVPVFKHRRYSADGTFKTGVTLFSDKGQEIINWPEQLLEDWPLQHYEEAVTKNEETERRYKRVVRILKKLRAVMEEAGIESAKAIPGFWIECMVYNVPNDRFFHSTWDEIITRVIRCIRSNMNTSEACKDWVEVSGWKYLFRGAPDSKRAACYKFVDEAWDYIGVRKYD